MTAEQIARLIDNPGLLNQETLPKLNQLLDDYPYFQTVRLLHLLNLHAVKDLNIAAELRKMAFYAGDRKKLYYLLEENKFTPLNIKELEKPEEIALPEDSFSLIDFFLSEKNMLPDHQAVEALEKKETLVSINYLSIMSLRDEDNEKNEGNPMPHQDVIDQFLKQNEIAPVRIELSNEESGGKDSKGSVFELEVPEEHSFFSETLAKIYLKQKKYDKALVIIRKLNLLYPEKNIYFADQIRFLEKLIINKK